jgi:hypothetical protein
MWRGGHHGIEVDLGVPSEKRLADALQAIWSHSSLVGCYPSRDQELQNQIRVEPYANEGHLYDHLEWYPPTNLELMRMIRMQQPAK